MGDRDVVLIAGKRTAIGRFGGGIKDLSMVEIGVAAVKGVLAAAGVDAARVDEFILGHARQAGNGPNPSRLVSIKSGLPVTTPASTIQQACVSSMKAVMMAAQSITLGEADLVVAAGSEHMSSIPYLATDTRWGVRMGDAKLIDAMYKDGFIDPLTGKHMGELTEALAQKLGITRQQQDEYAALCQKRVAEFKDSFHARTIVPIEIPQRKGPPVLFTEDEQPRADSTVDKLAKLPPAFAKDGTITAGNACGITDGAAAIVVASRARAKELGLTPVAKVRSWAIASVQPAEFGIAPVPASLKAVARAGLSMKDMGVVEINEAFAAQTLASMQGLELGVDRVNLRGGAISLGHPVGASGARVVMALMEIMKETGTALGLATICGNGGNGGAVVLEIE